MQNSNLEDTDFNQIANQIAFTIPSWESNSSLPYMEGVVCRPDNTWYGNCQYPNTETGPNGPNVDLENCLTSFFTVGTAQDVLKTPTPNPTMPADMMMGPQSSNVTVICPTNKNTVDFMINVAWAPGCVSTNSNGQVNIMNPIGDGSISGLDILRGSYYGCVSQNIFYPSQADKVVGLNFIGSVDPDANTINMVPGSAGQGYKDSNPPANLNPGVTNFGVGGLNQIGCLIYEVIPTKYRPEISVNNSTGSSRADVGWYGKNWEIYQKYWPKLPGIYYDLGAFYCSMRGNQEYTPCSAFPCSLDETSSTTPSVPGGPRGPFLGLD